MDGSWRRRGRIGLVGVLMLFLVSALAQGQPGAQMSPADLKLHIRTALGAGADADLEQVLSGSTDQHSPRVARGLTARILSNRQVSQNQDPAAVFRSGASETTIAASEGGNLLVAGWNDGAGFGFKPFQPVDPPPGQAGLSGYGVSTDGGRSWVDRGTPPIGTVIALGLGHQGRSATGRYITRGDPWLDATGPGGRTVYYANLAIWEDDPALPPAGVSVHKGLFSGNRFDWTGVVLLQSPNYPDDFVDKEALAASGDAVYVTLTNFIEVCNIPFFGFGQIELYRSLDGGASWARKIIQPDESFITDPTDPDCGLDGIVDQGSAPAVGVNSELFVVWERGWFAPLAGGSVLPRATIAFRRSLDMGDTWGPRKTLASICSTALSPPAAYNRTSSNDFPRIAVARNGFFAGRIFVTYQDCFAASGAAPFGSDGDIYVLYSDDGGDTWVGPTAVHSTEDGKKQFWPVVAVDSKGTVNVVYYEMRDVNMTPDPTDIECSVRIGGPLTAPILKQRPRTTLADVMLARSVDGGATWLAPVRVNTQTTNWCLATPINSIIPNFGDYNDARAANERIHAVWAEGRNADQSDRVPTTWYGTGR